MPVCECNTTRSFVFSHTSYSQTEIHQETQRFQSVLHLELKENKKSLTRRNLLKTFHCNIFTRYNVFQLAAS